MHLTVVLASEDSVAEVAAEDVGVAITVVREVQKQKNEVGERKNVIMSETPNPKRSPVDRERTVDAAGDEEVEADEVVTDDD